MREKVHKYIHVFALCLLVLNIAVSEYVTSISVWLLAVNWLANPNYKEKWERFKKNKSIGFFLLLYLVHIVWLINTSNFSFALNDLRIKLPLLIFPLVIGTTEPISHKNLVLVIKVFIFGLLISTFTGLLAYFDIIPYFEINNFRQISVFISHIRLALMLCLAIFIIIYFLESKIIKSFYQILIALLIIFWFVLFLFISQAFTGLVILLSIGLFLLLKKSLKAVSLKNKVLLWSIFIAIPTIIIIYLAFFIKDFYTPTQELQGVAEITKSGNKYYNDFDSKLIENGNYIYRDISEKELYLMWPKRSQVPLDSIDKHGNKMIHTLIRYMASKGLNKDAEGISMLTDEDIAAIETGSTNYRFISNSFINQRLYSILWQIDVYLKGGNPSGHSVTQRVEFVKAALILSYQNFWFGTGTGDLDDAYKEHYVQTRSNLEPSFRHRAHNQYLTFFISFGVFGAFICFLAIFFPPLLRPVKTNYYFLIFFAIALISMLNEDTLETMIGVIFFSFFYSLFLWGFKQS